MTSNHVRLNNEIMVQKNGMYQFGKDKEATREYFLNVVNPNTVFFHDLKEKITYLVDHDYYDKDITDKYTFEEIKQVFNKAYEKKFRFPSYMSAFKFYNDYALKTDDGERILERYEDRLSIIALMYGDGNVERALEYVRMLINQEIMPSTPIFLNGGRSRGGEKVSCFLISVGDSMTDINMGISTAMHLSKIGGGVAINMDNIRAKGEDIQNIENVTKGVPAVMKLFDLVFRYSDQQGVRQGSGVAYLNAFHADIHDFLDTKRISGDEDVRLKTLSIGVTVPDKVVGLAKENKDMYVFYPHSIYKEYGINFEDIDFDEMYDELASNPNIRKKKINARELFTKISVIRVESGYPYIFFSGNTKRAHPNGHISDVKFSNLCCSTAPSIRNGSRRTSLNRGSLSR